MLSLISETPISRNDARRSRIPDGRIFPVACVEPVQNISGVSIVTPHERNDSAFLREKCRPGIFLLGLAREGRRGRGAKARGTKTKAEQRGTRDLGRERERTGQKRPSELCFTRGDSRDVFAFACARVRMYL